MLSRKALMAAALAVVTTLAGVTASPAAASAGSSRSVTGPLMSAKRPTDPLADPKWQPLCPDSSCSTSPATKDAGEALNKWQDGFKLQVSGDIGKYILPSIKADLREARVSGTDVSATIAPSADLSRWDIMVSTMDTGLVGVRIPVIVTGSFMYVDTAGNSTSLTFESLALLAVVYNAAGDWVAQAKNETAPVMTRYSSALFLIQRFASIALGYTVWQLRHGGKAGPDEQFPVTQLPGVIDPTAAQPSVTAWHYAAGLLVGTVKEVAQNAITTFFIFGVCWPYLEEPRTAKRLAVAAGCYALGYLVETFLQTLNVVAASYLKWAL